MEEVEVGMRPWKDRWWRGRVAGRAGGWQGGKEGGREKGREGKKGRERGMGGWRVNRDGEIIRKTSQVHKQKKK